MSKNNEIGSALLVIAPSLKDFVQKLNAEIKKSQPTWPTPELSFTADLTKVRAQIEKLRGELERNPIDLNVSVGTLHASREMAAFREKEESQDIDQTVQVHTAKAKAEVAAARQAMERRKVRLSLDLDSSAVDKALSGRAGSGNWRPRDVEKMLKSLRPLHDVLADIALAERDLSRETDWGWDKQADKTRERLKKLRDEMALVQSAERAAKASGGKLGAGLAGAGRDELAIRKELARAEAEGAKMRIAALKEELRVTKAVRDIEKTSDRNALGRRVGAALDDPGKVDVERKREALRVLGDLKANEDELYRARAVGDDRAASVLSHRVAMQRNLIRLMEEEGRQSVINRRQQLAADPRFKNRRLLDRAVAAGFTHEDAAARELPTADPYRRGQLNQEARERASMNKREARSPFTVVMNYSGINLFNLGNIAAAVAGVSSLVSALGGVIAAAGGAATALASIGAVGVVGGMGVFKALSALKEANNTSAGQDAAAEADKRADALDRVADAQRNVGSSADNLREKQRTLAESYEKATRAIRDQNMQLEEAELSQEASAIAVARAQERLNETLLKRRRGEASALDVQEAQLGVKSARQRLREAQNTVGDQRVDTSRANARGVEGSDQVRDAKRGVKDAQEQYAESLRSVDRAMRDLNVTMQKGSASQNQFEQAMAKLTAPARDFVNQLRGLSGEWTKLREAVEARMFDGLGDSITRLARNQLPELQSGMVFLAGVLNNVLSGTMDQVDKTFTEFAANGTFAAFLTSVKESFSGFVPFVDGAIRALTILTVKTGPAIGRFFEGLGKFLVDGADMWGDFGAKTMDGITRLLPTIDRMFQFLLPIAEALLPKLEQAFAVLVSGLLGNEDAFVGTVSSLGDAFINLVDAITRLLPSALVLTNALASLVSAIPPGWLAGMIGGFLGLRTALTAFIGFGNSIARFGTALKSVQGGMALASSGLLDFRLAAMGLAGSGDKGVAVLLGKAVHGISGAFRAAATSVRVFTMSLLTNPVVLIIAAIVALGVALWAFFTKTETGKQMWSSFVGGLKNAWDTFVEGFARTGELIGAIWNAFVALLTGKGIAVALTDLTSAFGKFIKWLGEAFQKAFNWLVDIILYPVRMLGKIARGVGLTSIGNFLDPKTAPGRASGGDVPRAERNANGVLSGPGTGTSDSIVGVNEAGVPVVRVSTGEGVVNERGMQKHRGLFDAINADDPRLDGLPAFKKGGAFKELGARKWNDRWARWLDNYKDDDPLWAGDSINDLRQKQGYDESYIDEVRDRRMKSIWARRPDLKARYDRGDLPPGATMEEIRTNERVAEQERTDRRDNRAKNLKRFNDSWSKHFKDKAGGDTPYLRDQYLARHPDLLDAYRSGKFPDGLGSIDDNPEDSPDAPNLEGDQPNFSPGQMPSFNPGSNTGGRNPQLAGDDLSEPLATNKKANLHQMIVIHTTEGDTLDSALGALRVKDASSPDGKSYHTIIDPSGKESRYVPDSMGARATFSTGNERGLHVALVGRSGQQWSNDQLSTLAARIKEWSDKFSIPLQKIDGAALRSGAKGVVGHIDVSNAWKETDHTDPGSEFPYQQVLSMAAQAPGANPQGEPVGTNGAPGVGGSWNIAAAMSYAKSRDGVPYNMGGFSDENVDCTGHVSAVVNVAQGKNPYEARMNTVNEGDWLASRGFVNGPGTAGDFRVGWWNVGTSGGANGHSAGTFPDGTNFESGGNNVKYGPGAAGSNDPQFTQHMYVPAAVLQGSGTPGTPGAPGTPGSVPTPSYYGGNGADPTYDDRYGNGGEKDKGPRASTSISDAMVSGEFSVQRFAENYGAAVVGVGYNWLLDFFGLGSSVLSDSNPYLQAWNTGWQEDKRLREQREKNKSPNVGKGERGTPEANRLLKGGGNSPKDSTGRFNPNAGNDFLSAVRNDPLSARNKRDKDRRFKDEEAKRKMGMIRRKNGGWVSGPGGPREDAVEALLSDKEFVVNADAAKKNAPLLEDINDGKDVKGALSEGVDSLIDNGVSSAGDAISAIPIPGAAIVGQAIKQGAGAVKAGVKPIVKGAMSMLSEFEKSNLGYKHETPASSKQLASGSSHTSTTTIDRGVQMGDIHGMDPVRVRKELEDVWAKQSLAQLGSRGFQ